MKTKIIEASNGPCNWGKFMLCRFDEDEWNRRSALPGNDLPTPLLTQVGWDRNNLWVLDLQTGEGALFRPRCGSATYDLNYKHKIWVCPLYEPFLTWLYKQEIDFEKLPDHIDLGDVPFDWAGFRREGRDCGKERSETVPSET